MQLILYQPIQLFSYFEKTDYYGYVRGPASQREVNALGLDSSPYGTG